MLDITPTLSLLKLEEIGAIVVVVSRIDVLSNLQGRVLRLSPKLNLFIDSRSLIAQYLALQSYNYLTSSSCRIRPVFAYPNSF